MTKLEADVVDLGRFVQKLVFNYKKVWPCWLIPFFHTSKKRRLLKECAEAKREILDFIGALQDVLHKQFMENPLNRRRTTLVECEDSNSNVSSSENEASNRFRNPDNA